MLGEPRPRSLFFVGAALASVLVVLLGFAPTYFLKGFFGAPALTPLVHAHGLAFSAWIMLFSAQALLVARRRPDLHRRLGVASGILAALMLALGLAVTRAAATRALRAGDTEMLRFFLVPLGDVLAFVTLVVLGLAARARPETHKRLMLLATIALLNPAFGRWPVLGELGPTASFAAMDLFIAVAWAHDLRSRGRVHAVYVWGGLALVAWQLLLLLFSRTQAWLGLIGALAR